MRRAALLLAVVTIAAASRRMPGLPPIPPLPASKWPEPAIADPFARELMAKVPPAHLARALEANPNLIPAILRNLGTAAMTNDRVGTYLADVAKASAATADVQRLTALVIIDPLRYSEDAAFHRRINQWLPHTLSQLPGSKARAVLTELTRSGALEFDVADAAHLTPRSSSSRRVAFNAQLLRMPDDIAPIDASIYSLSTSFFTPAEIERFVDAVHAASPKRRLIVLGDKAVGNATFANTFARPFTAWPRDPFITARDAHGAVFINRPDAQPQREEDQNMVRALVAGLPRDVDASWNARWTVAPIPFHNGHILLTPDTVWISIHTVDQRALQMLGGDTNASPDRYFDAARRAAKELETFYGRRVRFVHPLDVSLADVLVGGGGFDLDSIVTILPGTALVGDTRLGTAAARSADWSAVQRAYPLRGGREDYIAAQSAPRTVALQNFLDIVAAELQRDGLTVRRLPLLNIPTSFVAREDVPQDHDFLITWNNVVLEGKRAEGFASLLSIDDDVRKTFAASGFKLVLFPPLTHSIVLGGGYRCASNHLRQ